MGTYAGAQPRSGPPGRPVAPAATSHVPAAAPGTLAAALQAATATDYPRAEKELLAIRGADQPAAQIALARIMLEQGRFGDAERYAQQAAQNAAQRALATSVRAEVLFATGKVADAIKLLQPLKTEKGAGARRGKLLLGEYLIASGRRSDADEPLMAIIQEYNDNTIGDRDAEGLASVARAAYLLRSPKDANNAFNESERVDKKNVTTLLWRAEVFLDKYNPGDAEQVVKEALAISPKRADALVAMARVKLEQTLDFESAEQLVKDALAVHPKHVGAYAVRAGLALHDMDLVGAESAIAAGMQINPNDLELWSLRAAAKFLGDDRTGYEAAKREAFARNKEFSRLYAIVGDYAEWEHRYDDIVTMMKEATKIDPQDEKAWAQLGLTLLRSGDETGGLDALKKAWAKDRYNVRVFNTLNLYEQTIPNTYDNTQLGIFKIRYSKEERPVLERYVPRLLGEAWGSMKARYGFVPTNPVGVELYGTREQFSVRTSGLPNIGIQGVCFGRVVAAMSPRSEPFNWGTVVWHELGHVFAIQLSKNHVPRWFTEGLSEYETIARRPEWKRELDPELYLAIQRGSLPGAVDMNRAFTHAEGASDVTVAYYAASQMLVFTVERFGMASVVRALKLWGEGARTADVIQRAFGVSAAEYDRSFREWSLGRMVRYKTQFLFDDHPKPLEDAKAAVAKAPQDASAHTELALAYTHARKVDEAKQELESALKLDKDHKKAHYLFAKLAKKEPEVALAHLQAVQRAGGDGFYVQMALADIAEAKKDKAAYRNALESAFHYDPSQSEPLKGLFDLAHEEKREADELEILRQLAPLEQHDRKIWRMLLERLVAAKRWDEARAVGESAIFIDVEHPLTHIAYARALSNSGDRNKAIFELESALASSPPAKEKATAHALLAIEYVALKNVPEARKHLTEAQRLDPDNADAKAVKIP
ncbi:tetratricopeptide repeat protein [Pendulispora albinea]|uniref:Tetratricopeptide repeat protein n=1 Tax=Pendulispora albinea TaxID=2741071 RepID=A0ABZ2LYN9_9BACT